MPVLILSTRADERRRARLQAIVRAVGEPVVFGPDSTLPDLWRFGAIVLDGDPSAWGSRLGRELTRVVEAGASLLTLGWAPGPTEREWVPILATTAGAVTQAGEVFARVTGAGSPLTVRLPAEFPIVDRFTPLAPADDATVAIAVRIGLRDLPAVVEAVRGRGRVVTCSLGASEEALEVGALARLIRRALRSREAGERPGRNIGVGIVGYGPLGGMGYHHGLATGATAGLELVAVAEPDVDRRKTAEGDFPGIRAFASVEDRCASRRPKSTGSLPWPDGTGWSSPSTRTGAGIPTSSPSCGRWTAGSSVRCSTWRPSSAASSTHAGPGTRTRRCQAALCTTGERITSTGS